MSLIGVLADLEKVLITKKVFPLSPCFSSARAFNFFLLQLIFNKSVSMHMPDQANSEFYCYTLYFSLPFLDSGV